MKLDQTVALLNNMEGRDKLSKTLQFVTRLIKYYCLEHLKQKESAEQFGNLSNGLRDARKLFKLFQSINDIEKIITLISKNSSYQADFFFAFGIRVFTLFQWIFENLSVLITIKFIKGDINSINKKAAICMLFACITTLIQLWRNLFLNQSNIKKWLQAGGTDQKKQLELLQQAKQNIILNIIKTQADYIVALSGSTLFSALTGKNIPESLICISGLTAGGIATYQAY